jgi:hypothetical protein
VKKLIFIFALALVTTAQVATNVVRLTPQTRLVWDTNREPDLAGYVVTVQAGTNLSRSITTNAFYSLAALPSGFYSFSVAAFNRDGVEGSPATISTNLSRPPAVIVNLRLEVTLQP